MAVKKTRSCVKRERPEWWHPEGVITRLQEGTYIGVICEQCAREMAEMGETMSVAALRSEVAKWANSASWGEQLTTALKLWKRSGTGAMILSKHWHPEFFAAMEQCGGVAEKAAAAVGVGYGIVLGLIDKRSQYYDHDFAEQFRVGELERIGRIRSKYMDTAENGDGRVAVMAQQKIVEAALPHLHGPKQEVHVSGKVDHDHQHTHGLSDELAAQLAQVSQERVRHMFAGRQREQLALEQGRDSDGALVIDLTPIKQQVEG